MLPERLRSSVCGSCSCASARGFATAASAAGAGGSTGDKGTWCSVLGCGAWTVWEMCTYDERRLSERRGDTGEGGDGCRGTGGRHGDINDAKFGEGDEGRGATDSGNNFFFLTGGPARSIEECGAAPSTRYGETGTTTGTATMCPKSDPGNLVMCTTFYSAESMSATISRRGEHKVHEDKLGVQRGGLEEAEKDAVRKVGSVMQHDAEEKDHGVGNFRLRDGEVVD
ncbi:hypothetical protein B0H14DRAFT_2591538 [Mycena olivaceomarginata]|nr:hypothetical protein B0H14DRAFT_2591538 [Mycena olivaceomarginata]